jgi:hypothetical protein
LKHLCIGVLSLLGFACSAPSTAVIARAEPVVAPAVPAVVAPSPIETPVAPPVDPKVVYRAALQQEVTGPRRLRHLETFEGTCEVRAYRGRRRDDGVLHLTLGLHAAGQTEGFELLTRAEQASEGVAEVLCTLGRQLRAAAQSGTKVGGYEAVTLAAPVRGLQFFDLLPAGGVRLTDGQVDLYRVVPLTSDEYEQAISQEGGQWSGSGQADLQARRAALQRWASALVHHSRPDVTSKR